MSTTSVIEKQKDLEKKGFNQQVYEESAKPARIWITMTEGTPKPRVLDVKGSASELHWSPAGALIAMVTDFFGFSATESPSSSSPAGPVLRIRCAIGLSWSLGFFRCLAAMRQGLQRFVLETVATLNRAVGEAWMRGELQVFEEHLYTELLQAALRSAINAFPRLSGTPTVLLTTFPGEQHGLGLLMVEALLVPEGAQCISLGTQTPLDDIVRAALAHKVHIVAVSFSAAFALRQAGDGLSELRRHLPASIHIWAGGEMTRRLRKSLPGVRLITDLSAAIGALRID